MLDESPQIKHCPLHFVLTDCCGDVLSSQSESSPGFFALLQTAVDSGVEENQQTKGNHSNRQEPKKSTVLSKFDKTEAFG